MICQAFLQERAELMAQKLRTSEEKALLVIIKSEASRRTFQNLKDIFGKVQSPPTQIDIFTDPNNKLSPRITLTDRKEIEQHILRRNRRHSLQSLATPFLSDPYLNAAINPEGDPKFDLILDGNFTDTIPTTINLSLTEELRISSLKILVDSDISLKLSSHDFKTSSQPNKNGCPHLHLTDISVTTKPWWNASGKITLLL